MYHAVYCTAEVPMHEYILGFFGSMLLGFLVGMFIGNLIELVQMILRDIRKKKAPD